MRALPYFRNIDLNLITFDHRTGGDDVILCRESYGVKSMKPSNTHKRPKIPVWERSSLSIDEAAEYSGVGRARLRELTDGKTAHLYYGWGVKDLSEGRSWMSTSTRWIQSDVFEFLSKSALRNGIWLLILKTIILPFLKPY